jgi:ribonuclease D
VRDDLLVEVSRRHLKGEHELHVVRGLARRYAGPLWTAIEKARALPADQLPQASERDQDPVQVGLVASVLGAALIDFCLRRQVAPNLAATNQDVKLLVRARLEGGGLPSKSLLTSGWRAAHILPHLQAILDGRLSVSVADVRSETPFRYQDDGKEP